MVCVLPLLCDFTLCFFAVPLQRDFNHITINILNRQNYGKDLCKWRRAGSESAAQRK